MWRRTFFFLSLALASPAVTQAHVGSPDIYLDANAGPYRLFVTVRTPSVIPGVADLEVRSSTPGITSVRAVPMPMAGPGAKFAPVPDKLTVSKEDRQLFTGALWMMEPGSWKVRIRVEGSRGNGEISIPVPAAALLTKRMQFGLGALLSVMGLFLVGGVVAMAGASVREARLDPGVTPSPERVRAGRVAMAVALTIALGAVWFGNHWWNSDARSYGRQVYKPIQMTATVAGESLTLKLNDPGWLHGPGWKGIFARSTDDLVPDHGHIMHLYVIRKPDLDVVYHLHPQLTAPGAFHLSLPSMPEGTYNLYADIVHANGFPETLVGSVKLTSAVDGRPLSGDDTQGTAPPWSNTSQRSNSFRLPDGYVMERLPVAGGVHAKQPLLLQFRLKKPDGSAPEDMALYMGMLGHAAFVKTDGTVFAHVHPTGSVSMAAFMLAQQQNSTTGMEEMDMGAGEQSSPALPNTVTIPYGFPSSGPYRVMVQMKHGTSVETGIFDALVDSTANR